MDEFWDDLLSSWWGKLLMAVVLFLITWAVIAFFNKYETTGEGGRVPWYVALVYFIGGKWVAAAPFALFGLLLSYAGIQQFRHGDE